MIKRVRICNFKSHGDVTVDLEPIAVLIGLRGTGKTNFVEALRFLRDYFSSRDLATAVQRYDNWERLFCAMATKPVRLLFDITFGGSGERDDYNYTISFQQSTHGVDLFLDEALRVNLHFTSGL